MSKQSHPAQLDTATFYEVGYAYPNSPSATKSGFEQSGCHVLRIGDTFTGFSSEAEALIAAKDCGLPPGYWSIDYPAHGRCRFNPSATYCLAFNAGQDDQFEAGNYLSHTHAMTAGKLLGRVFDVMKRLPDGTVSTEF